MGALKKSGGEIVKTGRKLESFFGKGTEMHGTLKFEGNVRFDGVFKGKITSGGNLLVGENGDIDADILIGSLLASGNVRGNILAVSRVQILPGGKIDGNVKAPVLQIDPGAVFNGKSEMPALLPPKRNIDSWQKKRGGSETGEIICKETGEAPDIIDPVKKKLPVRGVAAAVVLFLIVTLWSVRGAIFTDAFFEKVEGMGLVLVNDLFEKDREKRLLAKAELLKSQGDLKKAMSVFKKASLIERLGTRTRLTLARAFQDLGEEEEALREYERLLDNDPDSMESRREYLRALIRNNLDQQAVSELEKILAINGDDYKAQLELSALYKKLGKEDDLYRQLSTLTGQAPDQVEPLEKLADLQISRGEIKQGIDSYSRVVELDPDNAGANMILARLNFQAGFEARAVIGFAKQERLEPHHIEVRNNEGFRQVNRQNYSKALKIFNEVLEKEPENFRARFGIVTVYTKRGRTSKAIRLCEETLEEAPGLVPFQNRLAWLYGRLKINLERAMKLSMQTVEANPLSPDYLDTLSVLHYIKGERGKAVEYINKAIELSPGNRYYESQLVKFKSGPGKTKR